MKALLIHASAGAGHKRAAEALAIAFRAAGAETQVCDILDFTAPLFRKTYGAGYLDLVRVAPELWGYMYAQSDKHAQRPWDRGIRSLFNKLNTLTFRTYYDTFDPDVTVCTHFMPLELLTHRRHGVRAPVYCVVTDFAVHALWLAPRVSGYFVATDEARRHLLRRGQAPDRVRVTGIPIDPVFSVSRSKIDACRALGLDPRLPMVLIVSGGFGVGPTAQLIRAFGRGPVDCRLLVVAGRNAAMQTESEKAAGDVSVPVRVFGFVTNIHELMDAADLVVSKPGGLTCSEVLAKNKPFLIVDPIPGQEQRNCEYLLEAGAAGRLFDIEDAPDKIRGLLGDPARLAAMAANARRIAHPNAAREIAEAVMQAAEQPGAPMGGRPANRRLIKPLRAAQLLVKRLAHEARRGTRSRP